MSWTKLERLTIGTVAGLVLIAVGAWLATSRGHLVPTLTLAEDRVAHRAAVMNHRNRTMQKSAEPIVTCDAKPAGRHHRPDTGDRRRCHALYDTARYAGKLHVEGSLNEECASASAISQRGGSARCRWACATPDITRAKQLARSWPPGQHRHARSRHTA